MSIEACPNANEGCPYWNAPIKVRGEESGCFSDSDHIIPRFLGQTQLQRMYIGRPENRQQLCRQEHDIKTYEERICPPVLPSPEVMREAVRISRASRDKK